MSWSRVVKNPHLEKVVKRINYPGLTVEEETGLRDPTLSPEELKKKRILYLAETERKAKSIIAEAEVQAKAIMAAANQEKPKVLAAAKAQGMTQGQKQARDELFRTVADKLKKIEQIIEQTRQAMNDLFARNQEPLLRLAATIAGRIVHKEIKEDDETILRIASETIAMATEIETVNLRVNPDDAQFLNEHQAELLERFHQLKNINFVEDQRIIPGGCLVETEGGNIDGRLNTQLEHALTGMLNG